MIGGTIFVDLKTFCSKCESRLQRASQISLADHGEFMTYENAIMDFTVLGLRSMWRGLQRRWEL